MDYTEAEIVDALQEMGYMAPEHDTLHGIRSKLSSTSYLDEVDINELLTTIFDSSQIKPKTKTRVSQKYASLIDAAERLEATLNNKIEETEWELQETLASLPDDVVKDFHNEVAKMNRSPPPEPVQHNKSIQEESRPKLKNFEFDDENQPLPLDDEVEQQLINEVCRQRGLTRVHCPPPGRAPFKHDPVARNQQYQEVWKQFPVPGEKRRKVLRWKIRELMFRRDIPRLQLISNPGLKPTTGLKPWNV